MTISDVISDEKMRDRLIDKVDCISCSQAKALVLLGKMKNYFQSKILLIAVTVASLLFAGSMAFKQPALSAVPEVPECTGEYYLTYARTDTSDLAGWFRAEVEGRVGSWVLIDFGDNRGYRWRNLNHYEEIACVKP